MNAAVSKICRVCRMLGELTVLYLFSYFRDIPCNSTLVETSLPGY